MSSKHLKKNIDANYALAFLATILFGTSGYFIKNIQLPTTAIVFYRMAIPFFMVTARDKKMRSNLLKNFSPLLAVTSFISALRMYLWTLGIILAPMSRATAFVYIWPVIFCVLNALFLKTKFSKKHASLLLATVLGVIIILVDKSLDKGPGNIQGLLCILGVAILAAINNTIYKHNLKGREVNEVMFYDSVLGTLIYFPMTLGFYFNHELSLNNFLIPLLYGLIVGYFGYYCFYKAMKHIKVEHFSIIIYLEVVTSGILGALFFQEKITLPFCVGTLLIIISSYLVKRITEEKKSAEILAESA